MKAEISEEIINCLNKLGGLYICPASHLPLPWLAKGQTHLLLQWATWHAYNLSKRSYVHQGGKNPLFTNGVKLKCLSLHPALLSSEAIFVAIKRSLLCKCQQKPKGTPVYNEKQISHFDPSSKLHMCNWQPSLLAAAHSHHFTVPIIPCC